MTNHEKLKTLTVNELSKLIANAEDWDSTPWGNWFEKTYCRNCKTQTVMFSNGETDEYHECDFEGICPLYKTQADIIKLWLESEVKE